MELKNLLIESMNANSQEDKSKILKTFAEEPDLQIINGRYGAYIAYNKNNYKLPKGAVVEELNLDDCKKIIAEQDEKPSKKAPKKRTTKK